MKCYITICCTCEVPLHRKNHLTSYVCVLQGKDKQSVAVACCEASHPMSFKVPENLLMDNRCNMRICSQQFINRLVEANNFSPLEFHRVEGKYLSELNAVVFPIKVM